ncbi:hypothetical protein HELRODRAFT_69476 [Helobdella robusta]|uniref:Uncharacterized protein n=1 Tax=Helobdella robusta TaxID=6412 RepID=T1FZV7_HELRO|nr:hypothetical protein HELRODRAFT_69476 [Helobdella robusta]ESN93030.1 hypothetical protein HELRODRAFT_69476 [Helobdella robusta]
MADSKTSWPELVGKCGEEAKAIVLRERPDLSEVEVIRDNSPVTMDYREDRVRIFTDEHGKVSCPPSCG